MNYKIFPGTLRLRVGNIILLCLILLAALYSLYWYTLAAKLKENIPLLIEDYMGEDFNLSFKGIKVNGYPGNFRIIFSDPGLAAKIAPLSNLGISWDWSSSRAIVELKPWKFNQARVDLSGTHTISIYTPNGNYKYNGNASQIFIYTEISDEGFLRSARIKATEFAFTEEINNNQISSETLHLVAERLFPNKISSKSPTFNLEFGVQNLNFESTWKMPFGKVIERLHARIQVLGQFVAPLNIQALKRWRDDGGVIEFESLSGNYGPLQFGANGTLALDEHLQILAAVSIELVGIILAIELLKNSQIIQPFEAAMARMVFNTLVKNTPNNGSLKVNLPLNIQNGNLTINHVNLLKIPKIEWAILQKKIYSSPPAD